MNPIDFSLMRQALPAAGMLLCVRAAYLSRKLLKIKLESPAILWVGTLLLLIFHIGWKNIPFWINGIHHQQACCIDTDPKSLPPLTLWYGIIWYLGSMCFLIFTLLSPFFLAIVLYKNTHLRKHTPSLLLLLLIHFLLFQMSPGYYDWLLD
jgi:hypothetical protein